MLRSSCGIALLVGVGLLFSGCATSREKVVLMEITAYDTSAKTMGWRRGFPDVWNRYRGGQRYTGKTASGTKPREYSPGLFSLTTITQPWKLPGRILPWNWLGHPGSVAADTKYYPFGSEFEIPGYGVGRVEDRGASVKGPRRVDIYFSSRREALQWGRKRNVPVEIRR